MTAATQRRPHARPRVRGREAGFSFVEILIVMAIIAVLAGMVVVAMGIWGKKRPEFLTKQRLQKVQVAIQELRRQVGAYPPVDIKDVPKMFPDWSPEKIKAPPNRTNLGAECLVQCLFLRGFQYETGLTEEEFVNTDDDELQKAIGKRKNGKLVEIKDEWGNPLIYFDQRSYDKSFRNPPTYETDERTVNPQPWKEEDGSYANPESFQLFSMGPDGEPNTEDDIKAWTN